MVAIPQDKWFELFQSQLLDIANDPYGRELLTIPKGFPTIRKMTWNSIHAPLSKTEVQFEIRGRQGFAGIIRAKWDEFLAFNRYIPQSRMFPLVPQYQYAYASFGPFYPAAGANTPVDGIVARNEPGGFGTFSDVRNSAGTDADVTSTDNRAVDLYSSGIPLNPWLQMKRSIYGFDTSSIGSGAIVSAATFSIFGTGKENTLSLPANGVVDRNVPQSTNNLVASDYNIARWDAVEQAGRITEASWNTSGYNDFTLNTTGKSNVNVTGLSWYGLRSSIDFDNTQPSDPGASDQVSSLTGNYADQSGTGNDPKLAGTYSTPPPANGAFLFNLL